MSVAKRAMFGELIKFVSLIVVISASNAVSKRSFSAMHRVKTYLRSVMSRERLNSLIVLHIHKDLTQDLDLKDIGNEFCAKSDYPKAVSSILGSVTLMIYLLSCALAR